MHCDIYSGRYIDKSESVEAIIENDGDTLTLNIDGTTFESKCFDDFSIRDHGKNPKRFSLNRYSELTGCKLIFKIPIILLKDRKDFETTFTLDLELDYATSTNYNTRAVFSLTVEGKEIKTNAVQDFDGGLDTIGNNLPDDYKLKCCYGCAFSDYSVYGQGFYGTMLCFKNIKHEYLDVTTKDEYMEIMNNDDRAVQETFLCPDFQVRKKGSGYRG